MADFSIYPQALDGYEQLPLAIDGVTEINAASVNRLRSAIVNIEKELGVNPKGTYSDVAERLSEFEILVQDYDIHLSDLKNPHGTSLNNLIGGTISDLDALLSDYNISSHASTHISGGDDEILGSNIAVDTSVENYINLDSTLGGHLQGIDNQLLADQEKVQESAEKFVNKLDQIIFHLELLTDTSLPPKESAFDKLDDIILLFSFLTEA